MTRFLCRPSLIWRARRHRWRVIGFTPGSMGLPALVHVECSRCGDSFTGEITR